MNKKVAIVFTAAIFMALVAMSTGQSWRVQHGSPTWPWVYRSNGPSGNYPYFHRDGEYARLGYRNNQHRFRAETDAYRLQQYGPPPFPIRPHPQEVYLAQKRGKPLPGYERPGSRL